MWQELILGSIRGLARVRTDECMRYEWLLLVVALRDTIISALWKAFYSRILHALNLSPNVYYNKYTHEIFRFKTS